MIWEDQMQKERNIGCDQVGCWILIVLFVGGCIAAKLWWDEKVAIGEARRALHEEANAYYAEAGLEAAKLGLELARPYMSEALADGFTDTIARCIGQQISDKEATYQLLSGRGLSARERHYRSCESKLWSLAEVIEDWAVRECGMVPEASALDRAWIHESTPVLSIMELHQAVQSVHVTASTVGSIQFESIEKVAETQARFNATRDKLDKLLAETVVSSAVPECPKDAEPEGADPGSEQATVDGDEPASTND
ncbi:hypothetical protein ACFL2M_01315 [Patescibacteria group bacterium]